MKILKIQKNRISFSNGVEFSLSKNTIREYKLEESLEIDDKSYMFLAETSALSYSYWLLARRDYSRGELKEKLLLKYRHKQLVLKILDKLGDMSYLDDYEFASSYIASHKNWGRKKLEYYLSMKEVSSSIIAELLDDNQDEELAQIKKIWKRTKNKEYKKRVESLMRKGFQYGLIKKAIQELEDEEN